MRVSPYPVNPQLKRFMDVSTLAACDEDLGMLRTSSRLDSSLSKAMLAGRQFSPDRHSQEASQVQANFAIGFQNYGRRGSIRGVRDVDFPTDEHSLSRDPVLTNTASPPNSGRTSQSSPNEHHGGFVRGVFKLQSPDKCKRKRISTASPQRSVVAEDSHAGNKSRGFRAQQKDRSSDMAITDKSVQYAPVDSTSPTSNTNILSRMYASFGHPSALVQNGNTPVGNVKPGFPVKIEPNSDDYLSPPKRRKQYSSSGSPDGIDSRDYHAQSTLRNSNGSSQYEMSAREARPKKRRREDSFDEQVSASKRLNLSSEADYQRRGKSPVSDNHSNPVIVDRIAPRIPHLSDDNLRTNIVYNDLKRTHNFSHADNILHIPGYPPRTEQINVLPHIASAMGMRPDPTLLLNPAALRANATLNPFLFGVNACGMNPFMFSNVEQSEIMAAAAYRQALAAHMLQGRMAGLKPFFGAGLMDNPGALYQGLPSFMYGLPESTQIVNSIGAGIAYAPAKSHLNSQHQIATSEDAYRVKRLESDTVRNRSTKATQSDPSHSPKVDTKDDTTSVRSLSRHESETRDSRDFADTANETPSIAANAGHPKTLKLKPAKIGERKYSSSRKDVKYLECDKTKPVDRTPVFAKTAMQLSAQPPPDLINEENDDDGDLDDKSSRDGKSSFSRGSTYKNLTRERRLVANARERTRVHTISSAFEELRRQIPSYSCNQKLSKLAILRIACSYIQSLSVLAGRSTEGTFKESVDQCTKVLQAESKARCRRKNTKAQVEWEMASYEKSASGSVSSARKTPVSSAGSPASPPATDYWHALNRFVNQNEHADSSSNESETSSPSNDGYVNDSADVKSNQQHGVGHNGSSSAFDEAIDSCSEEQGPINVDD